MNNFVESCRILSIQLECFYVFTHTTQIHIPVHFSFILACGAGSGLDPELQSEFDHIVYDSPQIEISSTSLTELQETDEVLETSIQPETPYKKCLPAEELWCLPLYIMIDRNSWVTPPQCFTSPDECKAIACLTLDELGGRYLSSIECLRIVCPDKYSQQYTDCSITMAETQINCLLRELPVCSSEGVDRCIFSASERVQFMQGCL